jgi:ABC-type dipeptide/oligopeptide/nickel transport system permease subunit
VSSRDLVGRFARRRIALVAAVLLVLVAIVAAFATIISPYDATPRLTRAVLAGSRESPSIHHLFGTDELGRDQLTRVLVGLQKSLLVGLGAAGLSTLLGVIIGVTAGYAGGLVDRLLMRFTDLVLVLPTLAVLLVVSTNPDPTFFGLFGLPPANEVGGMVLLLAALGWMPLARVLRAEVRSLREREFVEAARAGGASPVRIVVRHLLPNCVGPIVVFATIAVGVAILGEATLSFLGAGIQLPDASLGNLVADAEHTVGTRLSYLLYLPGLVLFLVVLAVGFVGDGLRHAFDPRADVAP